jgi:hypothetical protein
MKFTGALVEFSHDVFSACTFLHLLSVVHAVCPTRLVQFNLVSSSSSVWLRDMFRPQLCTN